MLSLRSLPVREPLLFLVLIALAVVLVLSVWQRRPAMRIPLAAIVLGTVVLLLAYGQRRRAEISRG